VIAIVGGLGAAVSWAVATLCSSRSSRMIGASSVLAWVMIVGFVVSLVPAALAIQTAPPLEPWHVAGVVIYGLSACAGLLLAYRALTIGRVSIVAPIVSTEGAVAAIIAVALGEPISPQLAVLLAIIAVGIALAAMERSADPAAGTIDDRRTHDPAQNRRAVLLAAAAAVAFSIGLVASARIGGTVPLAWIVAGSRIVGILVIALPLVLRGGLRLSRRAVPLVGIAGILEAGGAVLYVVAAQDGVATAAVLGSQFAAIAAVAAFLLFGERLGRVQVAGVVVIALGVTILALVRS
jgi:drug/metabolite transporter (DMT)-like permease